MNRLLAWAIVLNDYHSRWVTHKLPGWIGRRWYLSVTSRLDDWGLERDILKVTLPDGSQKTYSELRAGA